MFKGKTVNTRTLHLVLYSYIISYRNISYFLQYPGSAFWNATRFKWKYLYFRHSATRRQYYTAAVTSIRQFAVNVGVRLMFTWRCCGYKCGSVSLYSTHARAAAVTAALISCGPEWQPSQWTSLAVKTLLFEGDYAKQGTLIVSSSSSGTGRKQLISLLFFLFSFIYLFILKVWLKIFNDFTC